MIHFFSSSAIENSFYLDSFQLSLKKKNTFSSLFFLCSYGWLSGYLTRFCQWYVVNVLWGGFMGISLKEREWPPLILPIYRYSSWSSNIHFCFFGFLENESHRWRIMEKKDEKLCPRWPYELTIAALYCLPPKILFVIEK